MNGDNSGVRQQVLWAVCSADVGVVGTSDAGPWRVRLAPQLTQVAFGSPSEVGQLPSQVAYIAAYAPHPKLAEAVTWALFGERQANGRLPTPIGGTQPTGTRPAAQVRHPE